jgi:hypothetical protein
MTSWGKSLSGSSLGPFQPQKIPAGRTNRDLLIFKEEGRLRGAGCQGASQFLDGFFAVHTFDRSHFASHTVKGRFVQLPL